MATPTLDEIEALARAHAATATLPGGYVQMDVVRLSDALLGLVAHVRALEAKVSDGVTALGVRYEDMGNAVTALEQKVAAMASPVIPMNMNKVREELDRLRAENAELRNGVECPLPHCECATWAREDVRAGEAPKGHHPRCVLPYAPAPDPQWPAPQPIETAPLGRILVVFEAGQMEVICPVKVDTESSWREFLKMNKATHWWPVPPPPGGGK